MRHGNRRFVPVRELVSGAMDWFLVLLGGVLLYWALWSVDVAVARWVIGAAAMLLAGVGLLCRYRHWRRHRQEGER